MKIIIFGDVAPFILAEIDQSFRVVYCLHNQGDLHIRRRENLK
jgi:hypothetical protein